MPRLPLRSHFSSAFPAVIKGPLLLISCIGLLAGCGVSERVTRTVTPYRIDVRQGNLVTQEMVAQLKRGMTRDQVRFILGTPLVTDIFHADRWDYVYRFQPGRGEAQQRVLTVYFKDDVLDRVSGDVVARQPGAAEAAAVPPAPRVIEIGTPVSQDKAAQPADATATKPAEQPAK